MNFEDLFLLILTAIIFSGLISFISGRMEVFVVTVMLALAFAFIYLAVSAAMVANGYPLAS